MEQRRIAASGAYSGRNVVVVGGTRGIGLAAVSALATAGANVLLVARDRARAEAAVVALGPRGSNVQLTDGDVSSMASVRAAAASICDRVEGVDAVLCNAAVPDWRASSRGRTEEGRHRIFATNYLGHYLMVRLLMDRLTAARGRVILIAGPQRFYRGSPRLDDLDYARPAADKSAYAGAKIACFCFASELARRHPHIVTAVIDPGLIATDFQKDSPLPLRVMLALGLFRNEPEAVGNLYSWLALDDEPRRALDERGENVRFFSPRRELSLAEGRDMLVFGRERLGAEYQAGLWEQSARMVGLSASPPAGLPVPAGARP
jgi:NAD(P)-dependent dehydrogenase (short-subunit alcohol dehydrogenase family)